jgi:LacI family transcriptional regulator
VSTLSDVARRAGVSTMTVSRVVNGSTHISEETRARVNAAIAELGYLPNGPARQLRSRQTKTLALVVTDIRNPFFTTIAGGVEDTARAKGYAVMFCNTYESEVEEAAYVRLLIERRVDGVLLVPASGATASLRLLQERGIPTVLVDRHLPNIEIDEVRGASRAGAREVVLYLMGLGHRRIALLTGPKAVSTASDRVEGYLDALREGCSEDECGPIRYGQFSEESGYEMTNDVLRSRPRPTAIFAANNFIAFGAIRALDEAHLRVPEDISIVVFDDLPSAWILNPYLTAVAQPAYEIGTQAATLLLRRLSGELVDGPCSIVLPTELAIRRSSAPPPRAADPEALPIGSTLGDGDTK